MRVHFAGTRGSTPVTAPDRAGFGGDTTCVLVTAAAGDRIVIDCGSGLPALAGALPAPVELLVLLTHFHLDHLAGLPAFAPLHAPRSQLLFAAPVTGEVAVSDALHGLVGEPYWPIGLDRCAAQISFADLPAASGPEPLRAGGLEVRWAPVPHPGGCTAYRIDEPATGASLVMITDAEWDGAEPHLREGFLRLCREPVACDLLICDGQWDDRTAGSRRGWGHTSWPEAVALAREAGAGRLVLTHHDPADTDAVLAAREVELQAAAPGAALARQGQVIDLAGKDRP